jgi:hypothetical protein
VFLYDGFRYIKNRLEINMVKQKFPVKVWEEATARLKSRPKKKPKKEEMAQ